MAKKTESKPKEQEAVQEKQEPVAEEAQQATLEKQEPERADDSMTTRLEEILNSDIQSAEENQPQEDDDHQDTDQPQEDDDHQGTDQPQEKILFYVKTVNAKTAVRSTPEYPMSGTSNVVGIITDRGPYGIVDVENGFGRIAGGAGCWIMLDSSVVIRQG